MKTVYFDCHRKGKVLAIIFDKAEDITAENLKQFMDCESDRYIKIILEQDGMMACQTAIVFELDNEKIMENRRKLVENDLKDIREIKKISLVDNLFKMRKEDFKKENEL